MQVGFYHLTRDPMPAVAAQLSAKVREAGERLLIVAEEEEVRDTISDALWQADGFLANGELHPARQPILLSGSCDAENGARWAMFADGRWREEASRFARVFLLFDDATIRDARRLWTDFTSRGDVDFAAYRQDTSGRWGQIS